MLTSLTLIDGDPTSSGLQGCTIQGLLPVFQNLPLLKVLRLLFTPTTGNDIRAAGDSCGQLTSFTLRTKDFEDEPDLEDVDEQAVAISQAMPSLTYPHLDVVARAVQQIEHVRLPSEPYKNEDGLVSNYG
ncbi:hypothetical protein POM88_038631 [Heracleum sosnowskyi]|uniref:Uncharacterized protein n=1 Tax=Heracleum sosnowskyi TaxID=360622 RepID=A0AAD8HBL0_9APIA|nr:hypothetical protein POM88_038631 [Heracleum sosnowskyi]